MDKGTIWINGCNLKYTDQNGTERQITGETTAQNPGAQIRGLIFVSGGHLKYYCANGHLHTLFINENTPRNGPIGELLVRSTKFGYQNSQNNLVVGHCNNVCEEQCKSQCEINVCQDCQNACNSGQTCETACKLGSDCQTACEVGTDCELYCLHVNQEGCGNPCEICETDWMLGLCDDCEVEVQE